jgi:RHS repeat-associated protein
VNNYTPITISYAPNGNITQKSDVGAYVYDATKINAVKEVSSNNLDVLAQQNITYSSFQSPTLIKEGDYQLELLYSHDRSRKKTTLKQNNQTKLTTYFSGGFEKQVDAQNNTTELHYLNSINTIVLKQNNQYKYYFTYKDHLGTIVAITDINGNVVEEFNYDAWGLILRGSFALWQNGKLGLSNSLNISPQNWTYELDATPSTLTWFKRGYTGHEHLEEFGLINMNSRLYDPKIGRMLSPDNYIQSTGYSQNYNRYSYVWNNPMKFTDPSGDFVITAMIIGAGIGMWQGGSIANGTMNPLKWDFSSGKTWGYMAGGAAVGALSGSMGASIAQSGVAFANTKALIFSSTFSSMGTTAYTNGATDVSVNFGFGSYNLSQNEFNYLGKKGNSWQENLGYGLGAMANIQDAFAGISGGTVYHKARKKIAGHSWIEGENINISVGPAVDNKRHLNGGIKWESQYLFKTVKGKNFITPYRSEDIFSNTLNNVNLTKLKQMTNNLNSGLSLSGNRSLHYGVWNGCVNQTSRALFKIGVVNVNAFLPITSPLLLSAELTLRNYGMMNAYYLTQFE